MGGELCDHHVLLLSSTTTTSQPISPISSRSRPYLSPLPPPSLSLAPLQARAPFVSRPRRRSAMSAAASSSIGESSDAGVSLSSLESVGHNDLLIVGPGVLGRIVAELWKQEYPGCKVHGQTATTDHHSELAEIGIIPSLKGSIPGPKFPYVIFCAPPYRSEDYVGDLSSFELEWRRLFPIHLEYCCV